VTSREIALVAWLGVALIVGIFNASVRRGLAGVVKTALMPKLLIPAIVSLGWVGLIIWELYRVGFWNVSLWWDTGAFLAVGATALVWRAVQSKDFSLQFYTRIVLQTLGLSVILGTAAAAYNFPVVVEILLVPWLVLLGGMQALAESTEDYNGVGKVVRGLVTLTGLAIFARAIQGAFVDYHGFLSLQTVRSLLLLFVLTLAYLPYLFLMRVWAAYDTACVQLRLGPDKSLFVHAYARIRMLLKFGFRLSRLERFRTGVGNDLRWVTSRQAVDQVFTALRNEA
jgi:hypothetical protein